MLITTNSWTSSGPSFVTSNVTEPAGTDEPSFFCTKATPFLTAMISARMATAISAAPRSTLVSVRHVTAWLVAGSPSHVSTMRSGSGVGA